MTRSFSLIWYNRFAEAHVHSSRRAPMLRRVAHERPGDYSVLMGEPRRRLTRIRARRILRDVYGEDHFGWDGS